MKVITNEWCCYRIFVCDMEVKTPYNQYVLIRISNSSYYSVSKLSLIDIYNLLNTLDVFVLWRSTFLTLFIMLVVCLTKATIIAKYYYKIIIPVYDYRLTKIDILNYTSLHISSFFVNTKIFSRKVALIWIEPTTDQTILQVMNTIQYSITFSSSSIYLASKWLYFDTTLAYNDVDC